MTRGGLSRYRLFAPTAVESGAVLTEVAIVLLLFLGLMAGLFEGSRVMWAFTTLSNAVGEGARYASVRSLKADHAATLSDIQNQVINTAVGLGLDTSAVNVSIIDTAGATHDGWDATYSKPGNAVKVSAQYTFQPIFSSLIPLGSFTFAPAARMTLVR